MNKVIHYLGLDVHKDSIAVSIAPRHVRKKLEPRLERGSRHPI